VLDILGRIERHHTALEFDFSLLDLGQHGLQTLLAGLRDRSRRGYRFERISLRVLKYLKGSVPLDFFEDLLST
jgi:hypothetical protein